MKIIHASWEGRPTIGWPLIINLHRKVNIIRPTMDNEFVIRDGMVNNIVHLFVHVGWQM